MFNRKELEILDSAVGLHISDFEFRSDHCIEMFTNDEERSQMKVKIELQLKFFQELRNKIKILKAQEN